MKRWLMVLAALMMAGCAMPSRLSDSAGKGTMEKLRYFRDERTGLCFAVVSSTTNKLYEVVSIANVPCGAIPAGVLE